MWYCIKSLSNIKIRTQYTPLYLFLAPHLLLLYKKNLVVMAIAKSMFNFAAFPADS